jgi:tape measure domain-containing protein
MTTVAELLGNLGIAVDFESVAKAQSALNQLRQSTKEAVATAELGAALKHVHGDAKQAAALIGVSYDAAGAKAEQAKKRTEAWGKMTTAWGRVARGAIYGVGAALGALYALQRAGTVGDEFTGAASKIRGMTDDVEQQKRLQDQLFESAQRTATGYGDVAGLYQQVGKAAQANGRTLEQAAVIVDTINMGVKASGAPAKGAADALQQLAQGLGSGVLRGQEFNSIIEQAPFIIDLVAKSLGKTRGEMRKMADDGKLTSKVVLKAFESQRSAVEDAFGKRLPQVGDFFTRMRNTVSKELATLFADKDVANGLSDMFSSLTGVLVGLIRVLADVGGWFGRNRAAMYVLIGIIAAVKLAMIALGIASTVAWAMTLAPAVLIGAAIGVLVLAVIGLAIAFRRHLGAAARWVGNLFRDIARTITGAFQAVFDWIGDRLQALWDRIKKIANEAKNVALAPGRAVIGAVKGLAGSMGKMLPAKMRGATAGTTAATAPAAPAGGTSINQTANVTINAPPGADAQQFAAIARREVKAGLTEQWRGVAKGGGVA